MSPGSLTRVLAGSFGPVIHGDDTLRYFYFDIWFSVAEWFVQCG